MGKRTELHGKLTAILGSDHVYFQPPRNVRLKFPCIIYELNRYDIQYADDTSYIGTKGYVVTYISPDPDDETWENIMKLPHCSFNRFFTADDLNHWVLELYY